MILFKKQCWLDEIISLKAIRHIGIVVTDLESSLHFYRDLLGLKMIKELDESGKYIDKISSLKHVKVKTVKMAADDGNLIELLHYQSHPTKPKKNKNIFEIGCSHVAFTVEDLEFEYQRLKKNGVPFNTPPQYSPDGYAKITFCRDPDGTLIELVEVLR
jgi:catechol 2,3-dioxygenase-like lactoylglutathione lyase family enzyme